MRGMDKSSTTRSKAEARSASSASKPWAASWISQLSFAPLSKRIKPWRTTA